MRNVILLTGACGSGKTEVAKYIERTYGFGRVPFAEPMYNILRVLGLDDDDFKPDSKGKPNVKLGGATVRQALQTIGDWGRGLNPDLWATKWRNRVNNFQIDAIADDCRAKNEIEVARSVGRTFVIKLNRWEAQGAVGGLEGHISEVGVPFDYVVQNNRTIIEAAAKVMEIVYAH